MQIIMRPRSLLDWIKAYVFGRYPTYHCQSLAFGPAMIEAANGDECLMVPYSEVLYIFWEAGYARAMSKVAKFLHMASSGEDEEPDDEPGAKPSGQPAPAPVVGGGMYI
ncbi:MAG: hypothetical protein QHG98_07380 [Methanothrix sp.]|nr:hypothetical protein [Methanothrix sp.]